MKRTSRLARASSQAPFCTGTRDTLRSLLRFVTQPRRCDLVLRWNGVAVYRHLRASIVKMPRDMAKGRDMHVPRLLYRSFLTRPLLEVRTPRLVHPHPRLPLASRTVTDMILVAFDVRVGVAQWLHALTQLRRMFSGYS